MNTRRQVLIGASALVPVALLAACAGKTPVQVTTLVMSYASQVANGVANVVQGLGANGTIPATVIAMVTNLATDAQTEANKLTATIANNAAQPIIQQIESDVTSFATDLKRFVLSPTAQQILNDVLVVLPVLFSLVGLVPLAKAESPAVVNAAIGRLSALPRVML